MPSSVAVTVGKTGPAVAVASLTLSNIRSLFVDLNGRNVLQVMLENGAVREFDINATTTFTCTITAGGNAAFTISQ
jgi:hypothetical protein